MNTLIPPPLWANWTQSPWTQNTAVSKIRQKALFDLEQMSFPTIKDEEWRYTNMKTLLENSFHNIATPDLGEFSIINFQFSNIKVNRLVFVNGYYSEGHSEVLDKGDGVFIGALSEFEADLDIIDANENAFQTLNTAFFTDGFVIRLPKNTELTYPVHIICVTNAGTQETASVVKNVIHLDEGSKATVFESNYTIGDKNAFVSSSTDIQVRLNAKLQYTKLQTESDSTSRIDDSHITQYGDSEVQMNTFTLGGALVRNNIHAKLQAPGALAYFNGLYLLSNKEHCDNHIQIDHQAPHCESHQLYKGILDDHGTGVFSGKILVERPAQKTNAYQSNKNILLSDDARIFAKPQLEIYADDVKCSHGETTGKIDQEALFYLQARGISEDKAKELMLLAFAGEITGKIDCKEIREYVNQQIRIKKAQS